MASFLYGCKADVVDGNLFTNRLLLLKYLLLGWPVLVPYDNDKNFEPCLKNGHKAHWAVLTGKHSLLLHEFFKNPKAEKHCTSIYITHCNLDLSLRVLINQDFGVLFFNL